MPTPEDTHRAQIAGLRAQVRELVADMERIESFASEMYPMLDPGPGLATCGCIRDTARAAVARARDEATEGED